MVCRRPQISPDYTEFLGNTSCLWLHLQSLTHQLEHTVSQKDIFLNEWIKRKSYVSGPMFLGFPVSLSASSALEVSRRALFTPWSAWPRSLPLSLLGQPGGPAFTEPNWPPADDRAEQRWQKEFQGCGSGAPLCTPALCRQSWPSCCFPCKSTCFSVNRIVFCLLLPSPSWMCFQVTWDPSKGNPKKPGCNSPLPHSSKSVYL